MKNLLRLEEFALLVLAIFLFSQLDFNWGWYVLLFLSPDISMLSYLANPQLGAWTYNFVHHKGLAVVLYILGAILSVPWLMFVGTLLLGHTSFDRIFGYGLKYEDSFQHTHLGQIGKPGTS